MTPENHPLTILKGFSTVSEVILGNGYADSTYESTVWDNQEGQRLRKEIFMSRWNGTFLQAIHAHFNPALRRAV